MVQLFRRAEFDPPITIRDGQTLIIVNDQAYVTDVSFEEFCASCRFLPSYAPEGVPVEEGGPCLVYMCGLTIDLCIDAPKGPFMLIISGETTVSNDLRNLERKLYEFGVTNGYL